MEYRNKGVFDATIWVLLRALQWVGIVGIAWNLFKPGGWSFQLIDLVANSQPEGYYYLGIAVLGLLGGKLLLDSLGPNALANFLAVGGGFAGTYFVLRLLPL